MSRFVVRDTPPAFPEVVGLVAQSVIAIAVGALPDDTPNIIGTGFALEFSEYFATCWHVAKAHDDLSGLSPEDLKKHGLKDATLRVAHPAAGKYHWKEIKPHTWLRGRDERADTCIFRLIGIVIPPLMLHGGSFILGSEVGLIGFPLGNALQGPELRPVVAKTVLAGGVDPTPANGLPAARVVLATSVAGGFSGAPVFSAVDGTVMGMVASKALEPGEQGHWPAGLALAVPPGDIAAILKAGVETTNSTVATSLSRYLASQERAAAEQAHPAGAQREPRG